MKKRSAAFGSSGREGNLKERVWEEIRKIPAGRVATYGDIARCLGAGPRAVGRACAESPGMPDVPCHRVVDAAGLLRGFNEGLEKKRALLEAEGVRTRPRIAGGRVDYEIVDKEVRWDGPV